jgi:hypothetical protein
MLTTKLLMDDESTHSDVNAERVEAVMEYSWARDSVRTELSDKYTGNVTEAVEVTDTVAVLVLPKILVNLTEKVYDVPAIKLAAAKVATAPLLLNVVEMFAIC